MSRRNGRPAYSLRFSSHLRQDQIGQSSGYGTLSPVATNSPIVHPSRRTDSELEHLLEEQHEEEDEHADSDGLYPPKCCWTADQPSPRGGADIYGHDDWPVYENIHLIRHEIINSLDDPYSLDQLKAPRMNISVVRPLVDQFYQSQDLSIVYCLLVNRTQFIREQSYATHHQTVNLSRALLCEIVAEKILRRYNEHNPGPKGLLKLANILVAGFEPFQNAPNSVVMNNSRILNYWWKKSAKEHRGMTALEVAIVSESKSFLASSACQKVVDAIYRGKLVYTPNSFIDILPDHWKRRPISLYDPRRGPLLNQYRLSVPRTRNVLEIIQFIVLLALYLAVMEHRETRSSIEYTPLELLFNLYVWGWILDQILSMLEHGWAVYTQNLWSFLDVTFSLLFAFYFSTRMYALSLPTSSPLDSLSDSDAADWSRLSLDALSCAAPLLIPRLAFNILSENLIFLSLRDMLSNFLILVLLASWCFIGFLLSLKWLHNGLHEPLVIGKWMIWIWFGLDGTGIDRATDFHWLLGPAIMILFAFLGNTLFVTILVSMLSNTFSNISANAVQEMQYRRSVLTFEGVKADTLFAFFPPLNLIALLVLLPLKFILSPRWFHKVNVAVVKAVNAPLLVLLSWYERRMLWVSSKYKTGRMRPRGINWSGPNGPSVAMDGGAWSGWARTFQSWDLSRFSAHGDIQAVFDEVPGRTVGDDIREEERHMAQVGIGRSLREGFHRQFGSVERQRRKSKAWMGSGLKEDTNGKQSGALTCSTAGSTPRAFSSGTASLSAKATLRQEYDSDSDGDDESGGGGGGGLPKGYKKLRRGTRKDSIMDFHENNPDLTEANARLHRLEESVERIEALLLQIVGSGSGSGEPDEEEDASPTGEGRLGDDASPA